MEDIKDVKEVVEDAVEEVVEETEKTTSEKIVDGARTVYNKAVETVENADRDTVKTGLAIIGGVVVAKAIIKGLFGK